MTQTHNTRKHHLHSPVRRSLYSAAIILIVVAGGTLGMRATESMSWLDAFYFTSMIATAQGPVSVPHTAAGKLFAAFLSFVSVGMVIAAFGFVFGPFLGKLWRIGAHKFEEERERLR